MPNFTHDHEIVIDSVTKRLNLMRDATGKAMYSVAEEIPNYQARLESAQKDWSNGHGQYEMVNPTVYFDGQSIDTTKDGRIFLGGFIQNGLIENFLDGAEADDGGAQTTELSASRNITTNDMTLLPAAPANDDAYYFGSSNKFTKIILNVSTAGVGTYDLIYEFYNGATWSTVACNSGTGNDRLFKTAGVVDLSLSFTAQNLLDWSTVAVHAQTMYWVRAKVSSFVSIATQPLGKQAWVSYGSNTNFGEPPVCFCWSASQSAYFVTTATKVYEAYKLFSWRQRLVLSSGTIADMKEYNNVAYIATGATVKYYYTTDGDTYTQTDLNDGYATRFLVAPNAAGTANVLWKVKTPNEIASTTDGRTVAGGGVQWASPAYIGDTSNNITNLFLTNDELMVGRADNLYNYDNAGGIHALMDELKQARSSKNFQYATNWQSGSYFSLDHSVGELIGSSPGVFSLISPLDHIGDIGKTGTCVGVTSDPTHLYIAMDEGTNTHIYKGTPRLVNQQYANQRSEWSWCPWVFLGTNACAVIDYCQVSTTDRRLYFGYGNYAHFVYVNDDPTISPATLGNFALTGFLRMSYIYGSNPYWDKMIQTLVTETVGCSATKTVQPKYRKDAETSMTNLTAAITTNGVVSTKLTAALVGKRVQFELDLTTDDPTITPQVLSFIAKGTEKPETFKVHDCTYTIGSDPSRQAETIRTFLRGGRTSTTLVKLADLRYGDSTAGTAGTDYVYVVMQPGYPQEVEVEQEKGRPPELGIKVRWQEVNYS